MVKTPKCHCHSGISEHRSVSSAYCTHGIDFGARERNRMAGQQKAVLRTQRRSYNWDLRQDGDGLNDEEAGCVKPADVSVRVASQDQRLVG
jgi:hypothetical protein